MSNLPPPTPSHLLRSHSSALTVLHISSNNERLYSADSSGLVVVTSTRSLRPLTTWNAHTASVLGVQEWGEHVVTFVPPCPFLPLRFHILNSGFMQTRTR